MPLAWDQLMEVKGGDQWSIATAREYVSFWRVDPWAGFFKCDQALDDGMEALGFSV
jgi:bifunctional non-homologous end joining protein LigD